MGFDKVYFTIGIRLSHFEFDQMVRGLNPGLKKMYTDGYIDDLEKHYIDFFDHCNSSKIEKGKINAFKISHDVSCDDYILGAVIEEIDIEKYFGEGHDKVADKLYRKYLDQEHALNSDYFMSKLMASTNKKISNYILQNGCSCC